MRIIFFGLVFLYSLSCQSQRIVRLEKDIDRLKKQKKVVFCRQNSLNCNFELLQNVYKVYSIYPKAKIVYYFDEYSIEDEKRIVDYFNSVSSDFRNKYEIIFNNSFQKKYKNITYGSAFRIVGDSVLMLLGNKFSDAPKIDSFLDVNVVYTNSVKLLNYPNVAIDRNLVFWFNKDKGILHIDRNDGIRLDTFSIYKAAGKMLDRYYESKYPDGLSFLEVNSTRNIFFSDTSRHYKGNGEVELNNMHVLNDSQVLFTGAFHFIDYADRRARVTDKWIISVLNYKSKKVSIRPVMYSDARNLNNLYLSTPSLSIVDSGSFRLNYACLFKELSKVVDTALLNPFVYISINLRTKPEFSDLILDSMQLLSSDWLKITSNGMVDLTPFYLGNGNYLTQMPPSFVLNKKSSKLEQLKLPFSTVSDDFFRFVNIINRVNGYDYFEHLDFENCTKKLYRTKDWINYETVVELPCTYAILKVITESKIMVNDYENDQILIKELTLRKN